MGSNNTGEGGIVVDNSIGGSISGASSGFGGANIIKSANGSPREYTTYYILGLGNVIAMIAMACRWIGA